MARSYGELERDQDGGVRCKGTLQRNKYLCSNCRPPHSPCSHSTSFAPTSRCSGTTKDGGLLNRLSTSSRCQPQGTPPARNATITHHAKPAHEHTLATRCEDSMGKRRNLWFAMLPPCHSGLLARPDRDAIVLILPRSERSRNATSTILRICLCARTDCVSLRTGSGIDWILPRRGPQNLAASVTGRVFLPGCVPVGECTRG